MADTLLGIDEVCKELQLGKEQVIALAKKGALPSLRDGAALKFRKADVAQFRQKTETGATVVFETPPKVDSDTSKIDLSEIESDDGADESDQTSVLAPVASKSDAEKADEQPVFEFSEKELGLTLDDEGAESVLVADESDSSLDILEVTEESSSDSATSAAELDFMDESSSGEDVAAVLEVEEDSPVGKAGAAVAGSTVTDILGAEEGSEEELETLDLEDVVETQDTAFEEAAVAAEEVDLGEEIPLETPPTATAETLEVGSETETVGIAAGEEVTRGVDEELEAVGVEDLAGAPEAEYEPAHVASGWGMVTPSALGNTFLILTILVAALGGMFLLYEVFGIKSGSGANPIIAFFSEQIASRFP